SRLYRFLPCQSPRVRYRPVAPSRGALMEFRLNILMAALANAIAAGKAEYASVPRETRTGRRTRPGSLARRPPPPPAHFADGRHEKGRPGPAAPRFGRGYRPEQPVAARLADGRNPPRGGRMAKTKARGGASRRPTGSSPRDASPVRRAAVDCRRRPRALSQP